MIDINIRSVLALLSIMIGTASVVTLLSASQLATNHALAQFESLGTHLVTMDIQASNAQQFLPVGSHMLAQLIPEIRVIAPYVNVFQPMLFDGVIYHGQVLGVTAQFASVATLTIARGRLISDLDGVSYYCMLGDALANAMRSQGIDPLGKQLLVGHTYFTIVGILKKWQPHLLIYADINHSILIPLSTRYALSTQAPIYHVIFRVTQQSDIDHVQQQIQRDMALLWPGLQTQFRNPLQIIRMMSKQRQTFSWLLCYIGGVSLVVAGMSVMNMILVSVIERRCEIGIRLAIGANQHHILKRFLVEALVLTVVGGLVGMVLGVFTSCVIAHIFGWTFLIYSKSLLLGFFISVLVGIVSAFYPAFSASRLDPIQSLRAD